MIRKEVDQVAPGWLKIRAEPVVGVAEYMRDFRRVAAVLSHADRPVDAPDADLAGSAVVTTTRPSVVKIRGLANGCQKVLEGTGFVVKPGRVMSNAHVVAGADSVTVESDGTTYDAKVVSYDPNADISILEVPDSASAAAVVRRRRREAWHRRSGTGVSRRRRVRGHPGTHP